MAILSVKKEVPAAFALRPSDAMECEGFGFSPEQGVFESIALSDYWDAIYLDGEFAAVWGYARESLFSATCFVWLLTTEAASPHKTLFAKQSIRVVKHLFSMYHELQAIVHKNYEVSLNWLLWLGFEPISEIGNYIIVRAEKEKSKWLS